ncbi:hypothetical protein HZP94_08295 [Elizabethkingia anophelis]|nr:hypothetical protein [Elizabethkingia anophelis]MCT4062932.1 hypothetical protein [Elizabethkingia anophelis]MCT4109223.1 hypothetical protein [Elizabethkingia anophelis]
MKGILKEILIPLCIGLISCRSTNDSVGVGSGNATVKIALNGSNFDDTGTLDNQASITKKAITATGEQRQEISLEGNNDYKLVATLTPINSTNSITPQATSKTNPITETETSPLGIGIKYKVVVYNVIGNYVKEQDFTSGQNTPDITGLDGGSTYTFVVYSIGSSTDLPSVTYSNPSNKTLSTASLNNVSGDSDLMYYSSSLRLSGNNINNLDIILKHRYSQINVSLDATSTNYSIVALNGITILPHNNLAKMQLSNGDISVSDSTERQIILTKSNSQVIDAAPVFVNNDNISNGVLNIKSISMVTPVKAMVTHEDISFSNLKINRGIKYNLKLYFKPNDQYLIYKGFPAVRINGFVWMRHNLGANIKSDPDTPTQSIIGNYYQFGKKDPVANGYTEAGSISGWNNKIIPQKNDWNSGTEEIPKKTLNDPCPIGWRVPSANEIRTIFRPAQNNLSYSTVGSFYESKNNFYSAVVFTSTHNSYIKMTFPTAGRRHNFNGNLELRGTKGVYYSSFLNDYNQPYTFLLNQDGYSDFVLWDSNYISGANIRCIAESPLAL